MIVYTPLWQTMKDKGISTYALINKHGISSSTINRLRHNKGVTLQTVDDLCQILNCKVEDIAEYIPNEEKKKKT
ncbi:MAG: helix-turn-helix transcriptional regulator [Oscillospiraceae bacterium]|nr:helix-turn-helix transcriptional regulator [Oscillospiraceae bacterium]